MKIAHIEIKNILGIKELELNPGKINIVSGKNASGKTSIFTAIQTAIKGGNDATLIHKGEEEGEIVLVFDNNYELTRKIAQGKPAKIKLTDANGMSVPAPQTELNKLFDEISINPFEFMKKKGKERLETLLTALNIQVSETDIKTRLNGSAEKVKFDDRLSGLDLIDNIYQQIYNDRTGINRLYKNSQSHAVELSDSLNDMDQTDPTELQLEYNNLEKKRDDLREKTHKKEMEIIEEYNSEVSEKEEQIRTKIAELKEELTAFKDEKAEIKNRKAKENLESERKEIEEITSMLSEIKVKIDNANIVRNTKENLEKAQNEVRKYKKESDSLSADLDSLTQMKTGLIQEVPIDGLEINEGEIYVYGIAYDRLNTAKQLEIALEVAKLRTGELKLICVDGIEVLDEETLEKFKEMAAKTEHQYIMTRVGNQEELEIISE